MQCGMLTFRQHYAYWKWCLGALCKAGSGVKMSTARDQESNNTQKTLNIISIFSYRDIYKCIHMLLSLGPQRVIYLFLDHFIHQEGHYSKVTFIIKYCKVNPQIMYHDFHKHLFLTFIVMHPEYQFIILKLFLKDSVTLSLQIKYTIVLVS